MLSVTKKKSDAETDALLILNDVTFGYTRKSLILEGVNLTVRPGEIIGISGENGSGKSTLLKLIVGLLKPKRGVIKKKGKLGYSPQELLLFENLTIMENFKVFGKGLGLSDEAIEDEALVIMKRLKFEQYASTLVKNLSGGTAQKLNFGIALLGDPNVLVLDEPYQGMDYGSFLAFWDMQRELRKQGKAIIIVSHLIEDQSKFTRSLHLINRRLQGCTKTECPVCCVDQPGEEAC